MDGLSLPNLVAFGAALHQKKMDMSQEAIMENSFDHLHDTILEEGHSMDTKSDQV